MKKTIIMCVTFVITIIVITSAILFYNYKQSELKTSLELEKLEIQKENEEQAEIKKQTQIDLCLSVAETTYVEMWDNACEGLGKKEDCSLPISQADDIEAIRTENKNICLDRFK